MCRECLILRSKNILIVGGALAMLGVLLLLALITSLMMRFRRSLGRVDNIIGHVESMTHLPIKLLERRLRTKLDDK